MANGFLFEMCLVLLKVYFFPETDFLSEIKPRKITEIAVSSDPVICILHSYV